jgi:hypothetical protein
MIVVREKETEMRSFLSRHWKRSALLVAGVLATVALPSLSEAPAGGYQWMPPEAADGGSVLTEAFSARTLLPVTITKIPKATAGISKFTKRYTIDLQKFNIKNDGTEAEATARGLNAALQDAKAQGANHIIFPKGTYLISEKATITLNLQDAVVDLNGATLQMNSNGLDHYVMVRVDRDAHNLRLTNGTLRGDRDTHDYKTVKGTHEACSLLDIQSGRELEFDHLTFTNAPGYAIKTGSSGSRNRTELLAMIPYLVEFKNLESGGYSERGEAVADASKTRTVKAYDTSRVGGEFEFGYSGGYMGFPFILDRHYQVLFYDAEMKFLEKRDAFQFRKVTVPENAKFMRFEFNQGEVSTVPAHSGAANVGFCGRITNFKPPTDVHFHDNLVSDNRALGLAFTGGQKWIIENNQWEGNGGQAPGYAIDFEDGWEMMQDVVLRRNIFKKNQHDLVVCAGSELIVEDNDFEKSVVFLGRVYNATIHSNRFIGSRVYYTTRTGALKIRNNTYRDNPLVELTFDGKGVADGLMRAEGQAVATPPLTLLGETLENVKQFTGTYLKLEKSQLDNVQLVAGEKTLLVDLRGNKLTNATLTYQQNGGDVQFVVRDNEGVLSEGGAGLSRKKPLKQ